MKILRFFLVMAVMFLAASSADAQNTMRIHQKDGTIHKFSITDVDFVDWCDEEAPEGEGTDPKFEDIEINGTTYHLGVSGAVDLGLSVKWATMNIGASSPGDYGDYYAWGEKETKSTYNWSTYLDSPNRDGRSFTKYAIYGKKTKLDADDDVAHVKWGGSWRMPTDAELTELRTKCSWVWTTYGGHNGYVVACSNGNAIFLPAAGYRLGSSLSNAGSDGLYWSSSLYEGNSSSAYVLRFFSGYVYRYSSYRDDGQSVRAVCP